MYRLKYILCVIDLRPDELRRKCLRRFLLNWFSVAITDFGVTAIDLHHQLNDHRHANASI